MMNSIEHRVYLRFAEKADVPPDFQGNPKVHGIDEPRGGGFSIMQNLQKSLVKEEDKDLKKQKRKIQEEEKINASARVAGRVVERFTRWSADGSVEQKETVWDDDVKTASVKKARDWWKEEARDAVSALQRGEYFQAIDHLETLMSSFKDAHGLKLLVIQAKNLLRAEKKLTKRAEELADAVEQWESDVMNAGKRAMTSAVHEAMYWCGPDRMYRLTKQEQDAGSGVCPRCKGQMHKESFTRQEKMFRCSNCGFKVPTGKITTKKIEIEIEPDGEVEVEVTAADQG